ncbi:MAG: AAA family ATPase [Acidobacteria bacterium]|nr:AAA family ATPase [Acidobacteriota bacterium]
MPRPKLILLVGLPGSGKSTYAAQRGWPVLSSDAIRQLLLDDATDQSANRRIFLLLRHLLKGRLELRRAVTCVDATSLTPFERRPYVKLAGMYDCDIEAVYFDVPLEVCRQRNGARGRVVPEEVLDRMAARLKPPAAEEGFTKVTVVSITATPQTTPPPGPASPARSK